jgi:RimJ/RimL family protein N-acetyltransferase
MLRGELVMLRARREDDAPVLHAELYEDTDTWARSDTRPWVPVPFGPGSPHWPGEEAPSASDAAVFAVAELATGELAGEALLWGIDLHNRSAHIGLGLRPSFRGLGLGADVVRILCDYGFTTRGLHRLSIETLSDNQAMIRAALGAGFSPEGTLRLGAWVNGEFLDEVLFGLLVDEWRASRTPEGS